MLMLSLFIFIVFLIGISWGSFLNVWIYRIPEKRSFAKGRSACMTCDHTLSHLDLVPLFSFLFLKGKCRYCKTKLSWQYPMIELIVGILFVLTYFCFGLNPYLWAISVFLITVNVVIAKIDWNTTFIPNVMSYPSIAISIVLSFFMYSFPLDGLVPQPTLIESMIGGFGAFAVFLLMHFLSNGGMGLGDAKWAAFIGFMFGMTYATYVVFLACFLSVVFSSVVYLVHRTKIKTMKSETVSLTDTEEHSTEESILGVSKVNGRLAVVFGPFLATAMLIVWFFGVPLSNLIFN